MGDENERARRVDEAAGRAHFGHLARSLFRVLLQSNLRHFMGPIPTFLLPARKTQKGKDGTVL